jgi:hypothetical protein
MPKTINKRSLLNKLTTVGPISRRISKQIASQNWRVRQLVDHDLRRDQHGDVIDHYLVDWDLSDHGFECDLSWEPEYNISQDLKNEFHRLRGQNYMIMNGPPVEKADRTMPLRRCKSTSFDLASLPSIAPVSLASLPLVEPDTIDFYPQAPLVNKRLLFSTCTNDQQKLYNSMPILMLPPPITSLHFNTVVQNSSNCNLPKNDTILEVLKLRQTISPVVQYQSDDNSTTEDYMSDEDSTTDDEEYLHQRDICYVPDSPLQLRNMQLDDDADILDEYVPNSPCDNNNILNNAPLTQCCLIKPLGAIWTAPNCSYEDLCAIYCKKQDNESVDEHKSRVYLNLLMHMQY